MPLGQILLVFVVGIVAGIVAALCGVGGGILMVPALVWFFGFTQKQAVATSLAAIILISIAGTFRNSSNGLVNWPIALACAAAGAFASYLTAGWLKHLSNLTLTRIFAILLILTGIQMLLTKPQN